MSTARGERRLRLAASRSQLLKLPLYELFELPGRPHVVYQLRSYASETNPAEAAKQAREDLPFLFKAFEAGQIGPKRMAKLHGGKARTATIHEYLDWTMTAQSAQEDDELDFGGFLVLAVLPRYVPHWPFPGDPSTKEGAPCSQGLGAPLPPLPLLQTHSRPVCAATIRSGPGYLEVPFVATHEGKRGRGYCRCLLEALEAVARAVHIRQLMLCSTNDPHVKSTWHHLGFDFTTDEQMRAWDIPHSDLMYLQYTTQMHKTVPELGQYRAVVIRQAGFQMRTYARLDPVIKRPRLHGPPPKKAPAKKAPSKHHSSMSANHFSLSGCNTNNSSYLLPGTPTSSSGHFSGTAHLGPLLCPPLPNLPAHPQNTPMSSFCPPSAEHLVAQLGLGLGQGPVLPGALQLQTPMSLMPGLGMNLFSPGFNSGLSLPAPALTSVAPASSPSSLLPPVQLATSTSAGQQQQQQQVLLLQQLQKQLLQLQQMHKAASLQPAAAPQAAVKELVEGATPQPLAVLPQPQPAAPDALLLPPLHAETHAAGQGQAQARQVQARNQDQGNTLNPLQPADQEVAVPMAQPPAQPPSQPPCQLPAQPVAGSVEVAAAAAMAGSAPPHLPCASQPSTSPGLTLLTKDSPLPAPPPQQPPLQLDQDTAGLQPPDLLPAALPVQQHAPQLGSSAAPLPAPPPTAATTTAATSPQRTQTAADLQGGTVLDAEEQSGGPLGAPQPTPKDPSSPLVGCSVPALSPLTAAASSSGAGATAAAAATAATAAELATSASVRAGAEAGAAGPGWLDKAAPQPLSQLQTLSQALKLELGPGLAPPLLPALWQAGASLSELGASCRPGPGPGPGPAMVGLFPCSTGPAPMLQLAPPAPPLRPSQRDPPQCQLLTLPPPPLPSPLAPPLLLPAPAQTSQPEGPSAGGCMAGGSRQAHQGVTHAAAGASGESRGPGSGSGAAATHPATSQPAAPAPPTAHTFLPVTPLVVKLAGPALVPPTAPALLPAAAPAPAGAPVLPPLLTAVWGSAGITTSSHLPAAAATYPATQKLTQGQGQPAPASQGPLPASGPFASLAVAVPFPLPATLPPTTVSNTTVAPTRAPSPLPDAAPGSAPALQPVHPQPLAPPTACAAGITQPAPAPDLTHGPHLGSNPVRPCPSPCHPGPPLLPISTPVPPPLPQLPSVAPFPTSGPTASSSSCPRAPLPAATQPTLPTQPQPQGLDLAAVAAQLARLLPALSAAAAAGAPRPGPTQAVAKPGGAGIRDPGKPASTDVAAAAAAVVAAVAQAVVSSSAAQAAQEGQATAAVANKAPAAPSAAAAAAPSAAEVDTTAVPATGMVVAGAEGGAGTEAAAAGAPAAPAAVAPAPPAAPAAVAHVRISAPASPAHFPPTAAALVPVASANQAAPPPPPAAVQTGTALSAKDAAVLPLPCLPAALLPVPSQHTAAAPRPASPSPPTPSAAPAPTPAVAAAAPPTPAVAVAAAAPTTAAPAAAPQVSTPTPLLCLTPRCSQPALLLAPPTQDPGLAPPSTQPCNTPPAQPMYPSLSSFGQDSLSSLNRLNQPSLSSLSRPLGPWGTTTSLAGEPTAPGADLAAAWNPQLLLDQLLQSLQATPAAPTPTPTPTQQPGLPPSLAAPGTSSEGHLVEGAADSSQGQGGRGPWLLASPIPPPSAALPEAHVEGRLHSSAATLTAPSSARCSSAATSQQQPAPAPAPAPAPTPQPAPASSPLGVMPGLSVEAQLAVLTQQLRQLTQSRSTAAASSHSSEQQLTTNPPQPQHPDAAQQQQGQQAVNQDEAGQTVPASSPATTSDQPLPSQQPQGPSSYPPGLPSQLPLLNLTALPLCPTLHYTAAASSTPQPAGGGLVGETSMLLLLPATPALPPGHLAPPTPQTQPAPLASGMLSAGLPPALLLALGDLGGGPAAAGQAQSCTPPVLLHRARSHQPGSRRSTGSGGGAAKSGVVGGGLTPTSSPPLLPGLSAAAAGLLLHPPTSAAVNNVAAGQQWQLPPPSNAGPGEPAGQPGGPGHQSSASISSLPVLPGMMELGLLDLLDPAGAKLPPLPPLPPDFNNSNSTSAPPGLAALLLQLQALPGQQQQQPQQAAAAAAAPTLPLSWPCLPLAGTQLPSAASTTTHAAASQAPPAAGSAAGPDGPPFAPELLAAPLLNLQPPALGPPA